jgi:hypothetical protein
MLPTAEPSLGRCNISCMPVFDSVRPASLSEPSLTAERPTLSTAEDLVVSEAGRRLASEHGAADIRVAPQIFALVEGEATLAAAPAGRAVVVALFVVVATTAAVAASATITSTIAATVTGAVVILRQGRGQAAEHAQADRNAGEKSFHALRPRFQKDRDLRYLGRQSLSDTWKTLFQGKGSVPARPEVVPFMERL